jgi:hypothetical protein
LRTAEKQEAMTTNSSGGIYPRGEGEPTEMEAFDALPPEFRTLLRECYFNWSAAQIDRALRLGMSARGGDDVVDLSAGENEAQRPTARSWSWRTPPSQPRASARPRCWNGGI